MSQYKLKIRAWLTLALIAGGGLLPGTCMIRTKQALIDGSKSFLTNVLLDPGNISELPFDEAVEGLTGGSSGGG